MSLRVDWVCDSVSNKDQDVVMQDSSTNWSPRNALIRAGRELSGWVFGGTPPVSPTFSLPKEYLHPSSIDDAMHVAPSPSSEMAPSHHPGISILPPELLQEVFEHYILIETDMLPTTGSYFRIRTRYEGDTTPMLLLQVCSSWRALAMSTASLWSELYIFKPKDCDLPLLEFWLERSAGALLDIDIIQAAYGQTNSGETNLSVILSVLHLVMRVSSRWRKMSLQLRGNVQPHFDLIPRQPLLALQELKLNLVNWTMDGAQPTVQYLTSGPYLRTIEWSDRCGDVLPALLADTPWTNIKDFSVGRINLPDLYTLLPHLKRLQKLSLQQILTNPIHSTTSQNPTGPIILPSLTHLSVGKCDDVSAVLDAFTLPCLSSLLLRSGISHCTERMELAFQALNRLVERSDCRVASLDWTHFGLAEERLVKALRTQGAKMSLQHLRHLRFGSPVKDNLVGCLTLGNEPLFPLLQSLELRYCEADIEYLRKFVSSRPGLCSFKRAMTGECGTRLVDILPLGNHAPLRCDPMDVHM